MIAAGCATNWTANSDDLPRRLPNVDNAVSIRHLHPGVRELMIHCPLPKERHKGADFVTEIGDVAVSTMPEQVLDMLVVEHGRRFRWRSTLAPVCPTRFRDPSVPSDSESSVLPLTLLTLTAAALVHSRRRIGSSY